MTDLRGGRRSKEERQQSQREQHVDRYDRTRASPKAAVELSERGRLQSQ
jgi:hypothetical protein